MKRPFAVLLLPIFLMQSPALAAFFQWTDANGVVHFTDDRKKIPQKYRSKAKELKYLGSSAGKPAPAVRPPSPAPKEQPAAAPAANPAAPGGHVEKWWREHFQALRTQLKGLQDGLVDKQGKLVELRRKRVIYQRPQDRVAMNDMQTAISADETKMNEVQKQLDDLDQQATRDAVPLEWRK